MPAVPKASVTLGRGLALPDDSTTDESVACVTVPVSVVVVEVLVCALVAATRLALSNATIRAK